MFAQLELLGSKLLSTTGCIALSLFAPLELRGSKPQKMKVFLVYFTLLNYTIQNIVERMRSK